MKKPLLLLAFIAILFMSATEDKTLSVKGSIQQWNGVLQIIEQSNAPHLEVQATKEFIIKQLQGQIKQDSVKNK